MPIARPYHVPRAGDVYQAYYRKDDPEAGTKRRIRLLAKASPEHWRVISLETGREALVSIATLRADYRNEPVFDARSPPKKAKPRARRPIQDRGRPPKALDALVAYLRESPNGAQVMEMENALGVSERTIWRYLDRLVAEGRVFSPGRFGPHDFLIFQLTEPEPPPEGP